MKDRKIIIKKVRKHSEGGGHGGQWKVAYADFVTAMMAFFLLLWLITMAAPEQRAKVADYFKHFSLFDKSGYSFMDKSSEIINKTGETQKIPEVMEGDNAKGISREELKERVKTDVEEKLSDVKEQIMVDIFEGGVRIQLVDVEGKPLFPLGSSVPNPNAKRILAVITDNIKEIKNKIAIEGHTDALNYSTNQYTNWELSTDRASAARKELENNGLIPDRLAMVAGFAATDLLIKDKPNDPRNRRISIILLYPYDDKFKSKDR